MRLFLEVNSLLKDKLGHCFLLALGVESLPLAVLTDVLGLDSLCVFADTISCFCFTFPFLPNFQTEAFAFVLLVGFPQLHSHFLYVVRTCVGGAL